MALSVAIGAVRTWPCDVSKVDCTRLWSRLMEVAGALRHGSVDPEEDRRAFKGPQCERLIRKVNGNIHPQMGLFVITLCLVLNTLRQTDYQIHLPGKTWSAY